MTMIRSTTVAFLILGGTSLLLVWKVDRSKQSRSRRVRRNLLPSPPRLGPRPGRHPGPPHPHLGHASGKYTGCLGLSAEELAEASLFKEGMPKCEIVVDGTTVVANTPSSSASAESDSANVMDVTTTTTPTVTNVYEDINTNQSSASDGSDDDIGDENDEVNVNDDYAGDQSSASGGEENDEDDAINNIEDNSYSTESVAYTENDTAGEAALDETFTDDEVPDNSTTVDESTAIEAEEVNPLHLFNMKECSSFSALWMWDLALTCSNSSSLDSCSCTAAKILIQYGDIDCANDECPDDCPVCDTCMKLSGCLPTKELQRGANIEGDTPESIPVAFIGLTAAMFGVQLVLFKMYWSRRSQPGGDLGSNLI